MADPFGDIEKVKEALSPELLAVTSDAQISRWLEIATRKIRSRFSNLDALITSGVVKADDVSLVCEIAAERVARNPDGWRQFGIDNGNGTRDSVLSDGQVKILPDEWEIIYPEIFSSEQQSVYGLTMGTPCLPA